MSSQTTQHNQHPVARPESAQAIAAMFDRVAPKYDFLNRLLSAQQDQRWRRRMVQRLPLSPGGVLLDVATGTGDVLIAAAKAHPEYKTFVGVDISPGMLSLAGPKAKAAGLNAEFRVMSATELAFSDASVDAVTISFGLRNVVDKDKALAEFKRVLKPGGKLLILEFFTPKTGLLGRLFQFYFHAVLPRIGALFSDRDAYTYLPRSVGSFWSREELRTKLYREGFIIEDEDSFLFGGCRLVGARKI
jgi:demethylmenaquinone methyltransferase/2-methoxy-6-polyprenyl-1,4-benzoquinol methylase